MKKGKIFGATLLIVAALLTLVFMGTFMQIVSAYAQDDLLSANSIFLDKQVELSGYLYNFDGSADYIYADFAGSTGYAIFAEESMELLEYATVGDFPYSQANGELVYGGPRTYFSKIANQFVDIITNEQFLFATDEIETISQVTREKVRVSAKTAKSNTMLTSPSVKLQNFISLNASSSTFKNTKNAHSNSAPQSPPLDESNWISPTAGATYITNSAYFLTAGQTPMHGNNTAGTCTTVATQLMLSYNNFYNDRRIIEPQFLHGGWNAGGNGNIFDPVNYTTPDWNPNVSTNYASMTSRTLGSNQAYHDFLVNNGITGYLHDAESNLRTYLNGRLGANNFVVDYQEKTTLPFGWGNWKTIASTNILAEINANRPVVIATGDSINGTEDYDADSDPNTRSFNHAVVAYGYQTFAAYAGSGDSAEYLGYIVNMGWDNNGGTGTTTNVWTNSTWYYGYLRLEVNNHTHNYNTWVGGNFGEARCGVCGHRSHAFITTESGGNITITGVKSGITPTGSVTIPVTINKQNVVVIGSSAFVNQTSLTQILIPVSVTSIASNAFENCTSLTSVTLSNNITYIGSSAFKGCTSLGCISIPNSVTNIGSNSFENCTGLTDVTLPNTLTSIGSSTFKGCTNLSSITIPNSVTHIDENAFENCTSLTNVALSNNLKDIGDYAFRYCSKLKDLIIPNSVVYIGQGTFSCCSSITNITIPDSVVIIYPYAFENCTNLKKVVVQREIDELTMLGVNAFEGCNSLERITVPISRFFDYKNYTMWPSYSSIICCYNYHHYTYTLDPNNHDQHIGICDCGHTKVSNHYYDSFGICNSCGYEHVHTYTYRSGVNDDGSFYHNKYCYGWIGNPF